MKIGVVKLYCGDLKKDFYNNMKELTALKDITLEDHYIDKITDNRV